jgi:hypothetical protein
MFMNRPILNDMLCVEYEMFSLFRLLCYVNQRGCNVYIT